MRLIDADALYEQTAEWEARALAVVEKLNAKPFDKMDVNEITEWRKWSCILNERSSFKHDVADAPTIEPQQWIPVSSGKLPENSITLVLVQIGEKCPDVELAFYDYNRECWENARHYQKIPDVVAWMPLPDPWEGEE